MVIVTKVLPGSSSQGKHDSAYYRTITIAIYYYSYIL